MWEFHCEVECVHCGNETTETFSFNPEEADQYGMTSSYTDIHCFECDKTGWYKCSVSFDVEIFDAKKKKPKER